MDGGALGSNFALRCRLLTDAVMHVCRPYIYFQHLCPSLANKTVAAGYIILLYATGGVCHRGFVIPMQVLVIVEL